MAEQSFDDAMVVIQEASKALSQVTSKLNGLQHHNQEVVAALKDLSNKVAKLEGKSDRPKKENAIKPPLYIRNLVRAVYKDLSKAGTHQFVLTESFPGAHNQDVASAISREVVVRHPSARDDEIQAACARYFRSLYEDKKRESCGSKDRHRVMQRRLGRKKTKLQNRTKQYQRGGLQWSSVRKERVKLMLSEGLAYVSSEDSDEDENGCPTYMKRPLPWLKQKYRKSLHHLDKLHYDSLSAKSRQMYRRRCDGEPSIRSCPSNAPDYLIVTDELNSSISSNGTDIDN